MQNYQGNVETLYLFSEPYGSDGKAISGAKVRIVPDCLLFHQTPNMEKQQRTKENVSAGELTWISLQSDKNGLLVVYKAKLDESAESAAPAPGPDKKGQNRFMVQPGQKKLRVQMLPLSDVNSMMGVWGPEEWDKKIAAILGPGDGLEVQIQRFDGQLSTKSVADVFSIMTESDTCVAPFCIPESDIQDGFYRLTFDVSKAQDIRPLGGIGGTWRSTDDPKSSSYELTAYLDFPLKSPLGDMQIVNGDPISLEEWRRELPLAA